MTDQTWDDMFEELKEEENVWNPTDVGERVFGEVREIDYPELKHGVVPRLFIREPESQTVHVVLAGRTNLKTQLLRKKVQPGDRIAIMYRGKLQGQGNAYHAYKVVTRETDPRNADLVIQDVKSESSDLGFTSEAQAASDDVWQQDKKPF